MKLRIFQINLCRLHILDVYKGKTEVAVDIKAFRTLCLNGNVHISFGDGTPGTQGKMDLKQADRYVRLQGSEMKKNECVWPEYGKRGGKRLQMRLEN